MAIRSEKSQMTKKQEPEKLEANMSAMIDVVFQLLIFFMLTLKLVDPEGDFSINMPAQAAPPPRQSEQLPDIKVKLTANPDGALAGLFLGDRNLGNGSQSFARLNLEILKLIGKPGNSMTKETAVEIDADYHLHFRHVINTVGACTGRIDEKTKKVVKYIEKIKFKTSRRPDA
jgi:biopolymer transport protein ExbD